MSRGAFLAVVFSLAALSPTHAIEERNWSRVWGSVSNDVGSAVAIDAFSNIYVVGEAASHMHSETNPGIDCATITCYDDKGCRLWTRLWGPSNSYAEALDVAVGDGSNIYVTGQTWDPMDGQPEIGNGDFFLSKFHRDGTREWTKIWGSTSVDQGNGIAFGPDRHVYVAGSARASVYGQPHAGDNDLCLSKFDADGNHVWTRMWGEDNGLNTREGANAVAVDSETNIYVTGFTDADLDGQTNNGDFAIVLTKFAADGGKQWTRLWGGSGGGGKGYDVIVDDQNMVYVTGHGGSFNGEVSEGSADPFLIKVDGDAGVDWTRMWGSIWEDYGYGLAIDENGRIYVTGQAASTTFDGVPVPPPPDGGGVYLTDFSTAGVKGTTRRWANSGTEGRSVACLGTSVVYVAGTTYGAFDDQFMTGEDDLWVSRWGPYGPPKFTFGPTEWASETNATVSWDLNRDADGRIDYSRYADHWEATASNLVHTTRHEVVLGDLIPGTAYRYRVRCMAQDGQSVTSEVQTFTTASGTWDAGVEHTVRWDGDLGAVFVDASGDVDRVDLDINGQIVGTWYGADAEWSIGRDDPIMIEGSNTFMATGYRGDGTIATVSAGDWLPEERDFATLCEIQEPHPRSVIYTEGAVAPDTNILLRVRAGKQGSRSLAASPFPGEGGGEDAAVEWQSVTNVRFYVDGGLVHTSSTPLPDAEGRDLIHEFDYDVTGLSTGMHRFYATFTPPSTNYSRSSDSSYFRVLSYASDLAVWREVDFNSTSNCLVVDLHIHNRGSGAATLFRVEDSAVGLQLGRMSTAAGPVTETELTYDLESRASGVSVTFGFGYGLGVGSSVVVRYYAVPILYPGGGDYQLGGAGRIRGADTGGVGIDMAMDEVESTIRPPGGERISLEDAVAVCKGNSDYLLVTAPGNLTAIHGQSGTDQILSTMAELATYRNGVLGYFHAASLTRTSYRSGDLLGMGYVFHQWGESDQLWLGDDASNRIHSYERTDEVLHRDINIPIEQSIGSGDALAVGNVLAEDNVGDPHPREEVAVAYGDRHGADEGNVVIHKFRHDPTNSTITNITIADSRYGTGGALLAGRFCAAWVREILAVISPDGQLQLCETEDAGSSFVDLNATGFEAGDPAAAGNLLGSFVDEIVYADVDTDRIVVYGEWSDDTLTPRRYTQVTIIPRAVDDGDRIAIGDVAGGTREEIVFADASENEIFVYGYDLGTMSFALVERFDWPFDPGDGLEVGTLGTLLKDEIVVVNGTSHDGYAAGVAQALRIDDGDIPGDRYALDGLINMDQEWARQLHPDWYSRGYLLFVGETDIIPAFSSGWRFLTEDGMGPHQVPFHDVHYADTYDELNQPDVAMGRIPGNTLEDIIAPLQTSVEIATGSAALNASNALAVAGEDDASSFRRVRNDALDEIGRLGFTPIESLDNTDPTNTLESAEDRDLIVLAGHGGWNVWDGMTTDDIVREFSAGDGRPLMFAVSCLTGKYPEGNSFPERFLRRQASAYIGATAVTYSHANPQFMETFFEGLNVSGNTIGDALKECKRVLGRDGGRLPATERKYRYHCAAYHYFGDPKLDFDWGGGTSGLDELGLDEAMTNHFDGPLSTLHMEVPPLEVFRTNGVDELSIEGGTLVAIPGTPVVPQHTVTVGFPSGCVVQAVSIKGRSGEASISGLNPEIAEAFQYSIAPRGGLGLDDAGWWPERMFEWSVSDDGDDAVLAIGMYPFYHNTNTSESLFYSNYVFDISYSWSDLAITDVLTDRNTYSNGQSMVAKVYLHSTNPVPMNVVLHPRAVCQVDDSVTALPIRELRDLSGWAGCRLEWDIDVPRSGEYMLEVAAVGDNEVVLDRAATSFEVGGADAALRDANVSPQDFMLGSNVTLGVTLDNTGTVDIDGSIHILVQDGAGNTVAQFQHDFTSLTPGGSVPFNTTWTGASLLPRNCRVIFYAVYGGRVTSLQALADGSADPLLVESIGTTGDQCVVTWPSMAGTSYSVWSSSNLLESFMRMTSGIPASPPYNSYTNPTTAAPMFYRIREHR